MGTKRIEDIRDAWRHGLDVTIECLTTGCGHKVIYNAEVLDNVLRAGGKSRNFVDMHGYLRCTDCRKKRVRVSTVPTGIVEAVSLVPPAPLGVDPVEWAKATDDRERKALIRRARG